MTQVRDISWQEVSEGTLVKVTTDGAVRSGSFKYVLIRDGEPRLLVRLVGIERDPRLDPISARTPELLRIRTGFHPKAGANEVHIVLDLGARDVDAPRVETQANQLLIWLSKTR